MNNVADFHCEGRFPGGTALAASFAALSPGSKARAVSPRSRPLHFNQHNALEKKTRQKLCYLQHFKCVKLFGNREF